MKKNISLLLAVFSLLITGVVSAQTTTRNDSTPDQRPGSGSGKVNVLIVPWEPRMFNASSDITRAISQETGQNYNQIQEALRRGMSDQFKKSFGAGYKVTSLLDDTAKSKGDLAYTYTVISTEYIPVNSPLNPAPAAANGGNAKKNPAQSQTAKGIKNGQIQVEQAEGEKFMNTVILSPNLLEHLKKRYNCEYVVFFNQLDLQNDLGADPYNISQTSDFKRSATLHWTIFNTNTGKRVAMGKTKSQFSNTTNTPRKIIDGAFSSLSKAVYEKFSAAVNPKK